MKKPTINHAFSQFAYFLITLYTTGRRPLLGEWPQLKDIIERIWTHSLQAAPNLAAENFVIEANCLHALLRIPKNPAPESREQALSATLAAFREASQQEWQKFSEAAMIEEPPQLWQEQAKIYPVETREALENMKEFIVQKLIEAEFSLTDPGGLDPHELWDVSDPEASGEEASFHDPEEDWLDWDQMI